jgi:hypothetical protein
VGAQILNDVTGECVLTDKEGRSYHLIFDNQAVMALEKITGKSAVGILSDTSNTDCQAMIMCGAAGWQRRQPGGPRVNGNLAQKIFLACGGYAKLAPKLAESLSCAEGMGFDDDDEAEGDAGDAGPFGSPTS